MADEKQKTITIDGAEYNVADLSENARNQVVNLRVTDAEIEKLKAEIAERLGFELIGHKLELYGVPIDGAEPCKREGLIFKRHAARVAPEDVNAG